MFAVTVCLGHIGICSPASLISNKMSGLTLGYTVQLTGSGSRHDQANHRLVPLKVHPSNCLTLAPSPCRCTDLQRSDNVIGRVDTHGTLCMFKNADDCICIQKFLFASVSVCVCVFLNSNRNQRVWAAWLYSEHLVVCEWAFCGAHGQASSRLWPQRWLETAFCGSAVQWQEETHTNETDPYSTAFV